MLKMTKFPPFTVVELRTIGLEMGRLFWQSAAHAVTCRSACAFFPYGPSATRRIVLKRHHSQAETHAPREILHSILSSLYWKIAPFLNARRICSTQLVVENY